MTLIERGQVLGSGSGMLRFAEMDPDRGDDSVDDTCYVGTVVCCFISLCCLLFYFFVLFLCVVLFLYFFVLYFFVTQGLWHAKQVLYY